MHDNILKWVGLQGGNNQQHLGQLRVPIIILLMFIYLLCHLHFGITYWGLNQCQQFSKYIKVAFDGTYMGYFWGGVLQLF